jgi:hypothetical protein
VLGILLLPGRAGRTVADPIPKLKLRSLTSSPPLSPTRSTNFETQSLPALASQQLREGREASVSPALARIRVRPGDGRGREAAEGARGEAGGGAAALRRRTRQAPRGKPGRPQDPPSLKAASFSSVAEGWARVDLWPWRPIRQVFRV